MLGEGERGADEANIEMVGGASAGTQDLSEGAMREMREAGRARRGSHQWRLERSIAIKLAEIMSGLSQSKAQESQALRYLWEASEGAGVLRNALSEVQAMGRSASGENQPAYPTMQVRRLTPNECERLMGFPDGHTAVPFNGKMAADGPRYRANGNSMAVPVLEWLGRRIEIVEELP